MHDKEQLVRYHSGIWLNPQQNYSTIDYKSAEDALQKDVKNLVSKQIFARWQAILSSFDFNIQFIKGENNSLPNFLTREFWQGKGDKT